MPEVQLECLVVREPYASLIAYGQKRWEFRYRPCRKRSMVGIVSSRSSPIPINPQVARSRSFPRGALLAVAKLEDCKRVTAEDLVPFVNGHYRRINLHGIDFEVCEPPIGEPVEDVRAAANDDEWECYAWQLTSVLRLKKPRLIRSRAYSTWQSVNVNLKPDELVPTQASGSQSSLDWYR